MNLPRRGSGPVNPAGAVAAARTKALLLPDAQPITARLAAAGSRRAELEALLDAAAVVASVDELRHLVLDSNVTRKASAISRQKVWRQLRERYVLDWAVAEYRAFTQAMRATRNPNERGLLCLLMLARADCLFRELTLSCVSPLLARQGTAIDSAEVDRYLVDLCARGGLSWTNETRVAIRRHALSALKDFGVLAGRVKKQTVRPRPGIETTLFAAQLARLEGLTDRQVLESRWFRLLGLSIDQVVELFYVANRQGALSFRMQAEVVELLLPSPEGL